MSTIRRSDIPASQAVNPHACDVCRLKKRKCDYSPAKQKCTSCEKAGVECLVTMISRPRVSPKHKKRKYNEDLEDRLQRLEALLDAERESSKADLPVRNEDLIQRRQSQDIFLPQAMSAASFPPSNKQSNVIEPPPFPMSPTVQQAERYQLALISPDEDQTLRALSSTALHDSSSRDGNELHFAKQPLCQTGICFLPDMHKAGMLLQEYLVDFNNVFPLFDPQFLIWLFEGCFSGRENGKPISWVATYVVLALAHRLRAMSPLATTEDTTDAKYYLERCLARLPDLLMQEPCLLLVQCLMGVALLLQTSPQTESAPLIISTALRLAQQLGYGESQSASPEKVQRTEQQRRVFWITFFMDVDYSFRFGRPPSHDYENIDIPLPDAAPLNGVGDIRVEGGAWKANVFRLHCEISMLQAEAIQSVFSVKARRQPDYVLDATAGTIVAKLHQWSNQNWLLQLEAADMMRLLHRSDVVHVVFLEAVYFHTVYLLQAREERRQRYGLTAEYLTEIAEQPVQPSHQQARRLLNVLAVSPSGDVACCWAILDSACIALCVLLTHISSYPSSATTSIDLQRSKAMLDAVTELSKRNLRKDLDKVQQVCFELYEKAEAAAVR